MSSLKPIGNIVVICCAFFIIFGILGVQVCGGLGPAVSRNLRSSLPPGPGMLRLQVPPPPLSQKRMNRDASLEARGLRPLCLLGILEKTGNLEEATTGTGPRALTSAHAGCRSALSRATPSADAGLGPRSAQGSPPFLPCWSGWAAGQAWGSRAQAAGPG